MVPVPLLILGILSKEFRSVDVADVGAEESERGSEVVDNRGKNFEKENPPKIGLLIEVFGVVEVLYIKKV